MTFGHFRMRATSVKSGEQTLRHIADFGRSRTLADAARLLRKNPEIITTEADALLAQKIAVRRRQEGHAAVSDLELQRIVLRLCREAGLELAFPEWQMAIEMGVQSEIVQRVVRAVANAAVTAAAAVARGDFDAADEAEALVAASLQGGHQPDELVSRLRRVVHGDRTEDLLAGLDVPAAVIVQQCLDEIAKQVTVPLPGPEGGQVLAELSGPFGQARGAMQRFRATGDSGAVDEAIFAYAAILAHPARAVEQRRFVLSVAGETAGALVERFQAHTDSTDTADLETALSLWRQAVGQTEPGEPGRVTLLTGLGLGLRALYEVNADPGTLDECIETRRAARAETSEGSPDREYAEHDLANTLMMRYRHAGHREDLDAAISAYESIRGTVQVSSKLGRLAAANLGGALSRRQMLDPESDDLERAIGLLGQAVGATPADAAELPGFFDKLGAAFEHRYQRSGDLDDLRQSIAYFERAVVHPAAGKDFALYLNNMAGAYQLLYARTNNPEQLSLAVDALRDSVRLTPAGAPEFPMRLANFGVALLLRYDRTEDPDDLQRGIEAQRAALQYTPDGSPEAAKRHAGLARACWTSYRAGRQPADLDAAVASAELAVSLVSPSSFEFPAHLYTLALALQERADCTAGHDDLERAVAVYRQVCEAGMSAKTEAVLAAAKAWGNWALGRESWQEAGEAYAYALRAAFQLVRTQLLRRHKELWLYAAQGVAAFDAFALGKLGDARGAVAVLEQGRAILLAEALQRDRADLAQLADAGRDDLRDRYQQAVSLVTALEGVTPDTDTASVSQRAQLQAAYQELDAATAAIRAIPGHERFLAAPDFDDVASAARPAPLVYLAAAGSGGLALIVRPDRTAATVWLPMLSHASLSAQFDAYRRAYQGRHVDPAAWTETLDQVTSWLWEAVMGRVLPELASAGHAVLIATGLLGLLPLHAAWTADTELPTGRRFALDQVLLTYAPSARALQEARRLAESAAPASLLVIDEPKPVSASDLPSARHEAAAACAAFPADATKISGQAATGQAVTAALGRASVLHFACHGYANLAFPLSSGLVLANDEAITVQELLTMHLAARQAVLSACESGLAGATVPDEVVGLPTGLLQAGVAGVVASLWAVRDTGTMLLMAGFYDRWRRGTAPAEAMRQAQRWLRDSTNGDIRATFESLLAADDAWLPKSAVEACIEAVILEDPGQRGLSDIATWAAFSYVGA